MNNAAILLTIAIPTYNRAAYLDNGLSHLVREPEINTTEIELMVSDNGSTDATESVVKRWLSQGLKINYIRNQSNIGPDDNFLQCFRKASGKYILILGDDDILLPGALGAILSVLKSGEYGIVHINAFSFTRDYRAECPKFRQKSIKIYTDSERFIKKIGVFSTFISMNITNKSLFPADLNIEDFRGTNLIQLSWIFGSASVAQQNAFLSRFCVAASASDSSGYQFSKVFVENMNKIFSMFVHRGVSPRVFESIKRKMLFSFYPANIIRGRKNSKSLPPENYFTILYPLYYDYLNFWLFTVPAIVLPLGLVYRIFKIVNKTRKKVSVIFSFLRG